MAKYQNADLGSGSPFTFLACMYTLLTTEQVTFSFTHKQSITISRTLRFSLRSHMVSVTERYMYQMYNENLV